VRLEASLWFVLSLLLAGCASLSQRTDDRAADLGYRKQIVQGAGFGHVVYVKQDILMPRAALHVYLEGDGTPWLRKGLAAADPTSRNPLMLDLMSLDPATAMYLGRPCYLGQNEESACSSNLWTDGRYSEAVVASMSAALEKLSANYTSLTLLGYSGGGTLAMLIAERQPKVMTVVTVAANLDTDRWADLHKQQRLRDSLNPASRPPLDRRIHQFHFAGDKDDNVSPSLVREAVIRQQGAVFKVFPNQDHSCCWKDVWAEILREVATD